MTAHMRALHLGIIRGIKVILDAWERWVKAHPEL